MNENKDIKIRSVSIQSYKGVENVTIDCSKSETTDDVFQWTVLLGNNNTGKTRILQAIADMRPYCVPGKNSEIKPLYVPYIVDNYPKKIYTSRDEIICKLTNYGEWSFSDDQISHDRTNIFENYHCFGYGVSRYPSVNNNTVSDHNQEGRR